MLETWHTEYLEDTDSYSDISFLNFQPKFFFGKFGLKKLKLFALPENWHTCYLEDVGSWLFSEFQNLNPFLGKSGSKKSKLSILMEN